MPLKANSALQKRVPGFGSKRIVNLTYFRTALYIYVYTAIAIASTSARANARGQADDRLQLRMQAQVLCACICMRIFARSIYL